MKKMQNVGLIVWCFIIQKKGKLMISNWSNRKKCIREKEKKTLFFFQPFNTQNVHLNRNFN